MGCWIFATPHAHLDEFNKIFEYNICSKENPLGNKHYWSSWNFLYAEFAIFQRSYSCTMAHSQSLWLNIQHKHFIYWVTCLKKPFDNKSDMRCISQHELSMNMSFLHTRGRTFHVEHPANTFSCSRTGASWPKHHLNSWCQVKHQHEQWTKCISYEGRNGPFCWKQRKEKMNSLFEPLDILTGGLGGMHGDVRQVQPKGRLWEERLEKVCVCPPICRKPGGGAARRKEMKRKGELKQTVSVQRHTDVLQNSFPDQLAWWPFLRW